MTRNKNVNPEYTIDCYQFLIDTLATWGITFYTGITGGGVIHLLKHLEPFDKKTTNNSTFLTFSEYNAGFVPLGYYLGGGKVAVAVATTGAATKLLTCGLSDAKLHDIPAIYIVPVSAKNTLGFSPLQDSSEYGNNILGQLQAELPNSVFILDNQSTIAEQLLMAKVQLDNSKPVVLVLVNEVLNNPISEFPVLTSKKSHAKEEFRIDAFVTHFRQAVDNKRLVILVGEEMARYSDARILTTEFCTQLRAAVVWSINGANAISRDNPYGYGYISFGGNDKALSLYNSLGENDVLLILGACPDEYTVNLSQFSAAHTFFVGNNPQAYGHIHNSLSHVAGGEYYQTHLPLDLFLRQMISIAKLHPFSNQPIALAPRDLNDQSFSIPRSGYVNMADLYLQLDKWWPVGSIGFDDVCLAYKDRQYVTQRPNNNIRFYSLYRGSAMGGAFGAAVGAKLSNLDRSVFLFTGDGCFRLFSGSLGEVRDLGLVVFLLNNETLSIVDQGLEKTFPNAKENYYHSSLQSLDYCGIAKAHGWDAEKLNPDLSNLSELLNNIKGGRSRSLLIEVPADAHQLLGSNPRLRNL